jgi:hypothetical protein
LNIQRKTKTTLTNNESILKQCFFLFLKKLREAFGSESDEMTVFKQFLGFLESIKHIWWLSLAGNNQVQ